MHRHLHKAGMGSVSLSRSLIAAQVSKTQSIFQFQARTRAEAVEQMSSYMQRRGACLVIDGISLQICLDHMPKDFITVRGSVLIPSCCGVFSEVSLVPVVTWRRLHAARPRWFAAAARRHKRQTSCGS